MLKIYESPVFDHCKETGDVGIPAFVFEDGKVSQLHFFCILD